MTNYTSANLHFYSKILRNIVIVISTNLFDNFLKTHLILLTKFILDNSVQTRKIGID